MLMSLGALGMLGGIALLGFSYGSSERRRRLEGWGGGLFIGGIALLSFAVGTV